MDRKLWIVLDTNVCMRLLVLDYATQSQFFQTARSIGARVLITEHQVHEVLRGLPAVFEEAKEAWGKFGTLKPAVEQTLHRLDSCSSLGADVSQAQSLARELLQELARVRVPRRSYEDLHEVAVRTVVDLPLSRSELRGGLPDTDTHRLEHLASVRIEEAKPPFSVKKSAKHKRNQLIDSMVWQLTLALLRQGKRVWLATTDEDFAFGGALHPYMRWEVDKIKESALKQGSIDSPYLEFFFENRNMANKPSAATKILEALYEQTPDGTKALGGVLSGADALVPAGPESLLKDAVDSGRLEQRFEELLGEGLEPDAAGIRLAEEMIQTLEGMKKFGF